MKDSLRLLILIVGVMAASLFSAQFLHGYVNHLLVLLGINFILAMSLNIINGYCGLFSLGHAGFFAVGAYSSAAFTVLGVPDLVQATPLMALLSSVLVGMLAAGVAGLIIGVPCLRLTGDYLAIATLGFGEIIRILLNNMESVGGSRGMTGIPAITSLPVVAALVLFTLIVLKNLIRSSYGRCIVAIREDEIAARSMGIDVVFYKVFSFVTGAMFAGMAGALFAHFQQFISPTNFTFLKSVEILLMIVLGGMGSFRGAFFGALVVTILPELLRFQENLSQMRILIFGLLMVVMMLWKPQGLMGLFEEWSSPFKRKQDGAKSS